MIKILERGNRRINVTQKSHKMNCLTKIQIKKIVSIKLSFSMSIQGALSFVLKFLVLRKLLQILTY